MNNNTVYMYTNTINKKIYVGRTTQTVKQRAGKNGNGYNTCSRFWNAICKYGWNNFRLTILGENMSFEDSVKAETAFIRLFRSHDSRYGYNILEQEPGQGCLSDEVKQKIKQSHIGLKPGMHKRQKRTTKYVRTEEHAKRLSESLKGNIPWNKGIKTGPLKDKTKKRMSEIRKNNKNSIHVPVRNIETGEIFRSGADAGRSVGCTSEAIFSAIKRNKPCKGYHFEKYVNKRLTTIESREIE